MSPAAGERLTYDQVLAANVRAERARAGISQQALAERMAVLGHTAWRQQTVGSAERGQRRVMAEEILGLALALETTISALMEGPVADRLVTLAGDVPVASGSITRLTRGTNDGAVRWDGSRPVMVTGHAPLS